MMSASRLVDRVSTCTPVYSSDYRMKGEGSGMDCILVLDGSHASRVISCVCPA